MVFKGPQRVIIDGDMSGNLTSNVTVMDQLVMISYSIVWLGSSPLGTIVVEVSDDYTQNAEGITKNPGTWNALPLSATTDVSGNADHGFIDIDAHAGYAIRLRYEATSGTGALNVLVMGK